MYVKEYWRIEFLVDSNFFFFFLLVGGGVFISKKEEEKLFVELSVFCIFGEEVFFKRYCVLFYSCFGI